MQSIQADKKGRVYLLRSESLEVYPIDKDQQLGKPTKLKAMGLEGGPPERVAAMGDGPGDWILLGANLRWFVDGQEISLTEPNQIVLSATLVDGDPVVLLAPVKVHRRRGEVLEELPTFARWDGEDWDDFFVEPVVDFEENPFSNKAMISRLVLLAPDAEDTLWTAHVYKPLIRHFDVNGRLRMELTAGDEARELPAAEVEGIRQDLEKVVTAERADRKPLSKTVTVMTAEPFCEAIAVAGNGMVYFLIADLEKRGKYRLRRWDPLRQALEDVALPIDLPSGATMASAKDGLHIAHWDSSQGRFFIPAERLETAAWRRVEGAQMDGAELSVSEDPGTDK